MEISLEKVDLIRARTGVGYREARDALEKAGGDVVEALILLEEKGKEKPLRERIQVQGEEVMSKVRELIREGNVTKIVVKQGGDTVVEFPVTVGAIGAVIAPALAAFGVAAALAARCTIEVERKKADGGPEAEADDQPVTFAQDVDR